MEHLNKHQIVLLTLFTSFVASIATGITVVSLLDQASPGVTQTINRVVERTIEKVIPTDSNVKGVTQTVPVATDDATVSAIDRAFRSTVRIFLKTTDGASLNTFVGMGIIVNTKGTVITEKNIVNPASEYIVRFNDGKEIEYAAAPADTLISVTGSAAQNSQSSTANGQTANVLGSVGQNSQNGQTTPATAPETNLADATSVTEVTSAVGALVPKGTTDYSFTPATLSKANARLGQNVIGLGGATTNAVQVGIVSSVIKATATDASTTPPIIAIATTLSVESVITGSPLVGANGDIIGLTLPSSGFTKTNYIPAALIATLIK